MSFKTPIICDRRVYDKKGKWQNPNQDLHDNIFYFIKEPLSIEQGYRNGRETMIETLTITVFGGKQIVKGDKITLETGEEMEVHDITINYIESNIAIKDLVKPRIESMELHLQ